jgi:Beta-ketoacyl synthase, N-terminal domain
MKPTTHLQLGLRGIASIGPGFDHWAALSAIMSGQIPYTAAASNLPPSSALPPTERRRVGLSVKVALAVAEQLFANTPEADATRTATVFTSSGGDGDNCHHLCTALTEPPVMLSPTKFTNSVHNAPAGYFGIAHHAVQPSNSICARDGSFALGLLEAAAYLACEQSAVALVAYDVPYPEPLNSKRHILAPMGIALLLDHADHPACIAQLSLQGLDARALAPTQMQNAELEAIRRNIPAARGLPLLQALWLAAQQGTSQALVVDAGDTDSLSVQVIHANGLRL